MKKLIFTLIIFLSFKSFAQTNFSKLAIGIGGNVTTAFTGLTYGSSPIIPGYNPVKTFSINKEKSFSGSFDYFFTPNLLAGIEFNSISLKDGTDKHNRAFVSKFSVVEIKGNVSLGEFVEFNQYYDALYYLKNFNVGLGLGLAFGNNNVANYDPVNKPFPSRQHDDDLGKSKFSGVLTFPIVLGYNINFNNAYDEPKVVLGFNYKMVFTSSDDIDGFADNPAIFENNANDSYTTFGISLKYLFGPKGFYN